MSKEGRQKALETTLASLNKRYGDGVVMKLGEATQLAVEAIPTGSLSLDIALGVGGVPRGRIVEIYGPESSGKTTLCLHVIAEAQQLGGICGFVDVEHALDPAYAGQDRRGRQQSLHQPAGHRRAGAGDRRGAGALRRDGCGGGGQRGGAWCRAPRSKARWATATWACRRA